MQIAGDVDLPTVVEREVRAGRSWRCGAEVSGTYYIGKSWNDVQRFRSGELSRLRRPGRGSGNTPRRAYVALS